MTTIFAYDPGGGSTSATPEIDVTSLGAAMTLLASAVLVVRDRYRSIMSETTDKDDSL